MYVAHWLVCGHVSPHTTMPVNITVYKYAMLHNNASNLLSMSVQAICQNFLETLRVLPIFLSELFAHLFLHLWPPNMWLFWPLSTCEMLCEPGGPIKHENALFSAWRPPPENEGSRKDDSIIALQHLILAWRAAFWERFHSSLISPLETGWLIGWMSSFLPKRDSRASPATCSSLCGALPGSFKRTSLVFLSSFNECWNILMTFSVMCDVLTFLTKWLWTRMHSQPKSPEVLAGSIFMWGGAEGFIFCCLDDHVVPF